MTAIGWYVHHQGAGHLIRARAAAAHLPEITVLSSLSPPGGWRGDWIQLPRDDEDGAEDAEAGGALHWAPVGSDGLRRRMATISAWIAENRPRAFVVDVSVEVALLARLHGVPTLVVAQRGRRGDRPHQMAFASAAAVLAPWSEATHLPDHGLPDDRLRFLGAVSRFGQAAGRPEPGGDVLVLIGFGGCDLDAEAIAEGAAETPERRWHVAGPLRVEGPPNLRDHGPDADVKALIDRAGVVVGTAGNNTIAEVAAARRHFVCFPQRRPFEEQLQAARALARIEVAQICLEPPGPGEWGSVLAAAERRPTERWAELEDGHGAERLAAAVREVAGI